MRWEDKDHEGKYKQVNEGTAGEHIERRKRKITGKREAGGGR